MIDLKAIAHGIRHGQRALVVGVAVVTATAITATSVLGAAVTDVLNGTATTGSATGLPVNITGTEVLPPGCTIFDPTTPCQRSTYTYEAAGKAKGDVKGTFVYREQGAFTQAVTGDLAGQLVGSEFFSGVFTVDPKKDGPNMVVSNTSVVIGGGVIGKKNALPKDDAKLIQKLGLKAGQAYATFTFPGPCGPQTGFATPDFREIAIELSLSC